MDKKFITSLIIIILLIGALFAFNKFSYNQDTREQNYMPNNQSSNIKNNISGVQITPIEHATMVLKWNGKVIYTDPVYPESGAIAFVGQPAPDLILITDIHSDHLNIETLKGVSKEKTIIVAPKAVADMLPTGVEALPGTLVILGNGQMTDELGFNIEAIPMYNLPEKPDAYHTKGRGNGYVVEALGERVYISGDTSDIPEMRNLKNIDIAFVCMNLPYTMSVESAASGVLAFKPKHVYPYHYKGTDGLSDINKFKELVNKGDPNIDVVLLNWYPN